MISIERDTISEIIFSERNLKKRTKEARFLIDSSLEITHLKNHYHNFFELGLWHARETKCKTLESKSTALVIIMY